MPSRLNYSRKALVQVDIDYIEKSLHKILEMPITADSGKKYKYNETERRKLKRIIQWATDNNSNENAGSLLVSDAEGEVSMSVFELQSLQDELESKANERAMQAEQGFVAYRQSLSLGGVNQKQIDDWVASFG